MKKIILSIIPVLFLLSIPSKAYAYWHFAGMSIPTSFTEVKQIFLPSNSNKGDNIKIDTKETEVNTEKTETTDQATLKEINTEDLTAVDGDKTVDKSWSLAISQSELNRYINSYLIGQTFAGYTVNKGSAALQKGKGILNLTINNDYGIYIELTPDEAGKNLIVKKLENTGDRKFSGIEMLAIRQFAANARKLAFNSYPEYKDSFEKIEFDQGQLIVSFSK